MDDGLQKEVVCVPITPAKQYETRSVMESINEALEMNDKVLFSLDGDRSSKHFEATVISCDGKERITATRNISNSSIGVTNDVFPLTDALLGSGVCSSRSRLDDEIMLPCSACPINLSQNISIPATPQYEVENKRCSIGSNPYVEATYTRASSQHKPNERKRRGVGIDAIQSQKPKRKKYRPRIHDEFKPRKSQKVQTPRRTNEKRSFRKKQLKSQSGLKDLGARGVGSVARSCKRALNFNSEYLNRAENCVNSFDAVGQVDKNSKDDIIISKAFNSEYHNSAETCVNESSKFFEVVHKKTKDVINITEVPNKVCCNLKSVKVYSRRKWCPGQCLRNSRMLRPYFPRLYKRKRMIGHQATTIFWGNRDIAKKKVFLITEKQVKAAVADRIPYKCALSLDVFATCTKIRTKRCKIGNLSSSNGDIPPTTNDQVKQVDEPLTNENLVANALPESDIMDKQLDESTAGVICPSQNVCSTSKIFSSDLIEEADGSRMINVTVQDVEIPLDCVDKSIRIKISRELVEESLKFVICPKDIQNFGQNCLGFYSKGSTASGLIEHITKMLKRLNIQDELALVISRPKKRKIYPKVNVDSVPLTLELWEKLMESDERVRVMLLIGSDDREHDEKTKIGEEQWRKEKEIFIKRVLTFNERMHTVQGPRRFSRWKGSVVDSVIGVYITQNVSDHFSSSAYLTLVARFPLMPRGGCEETERGGGQGKGGDGSESGSGVANNYTVELLSEDDYSTDDDDDEEDPCHFSDDLSHTSVNSTGESNVISVDLGNGNILQNDNIPKEKEQRIYDSCTSQLSCSQHDVTKEQGLQSIINHESNVEEVISSEQDLQSINNNESNDKEFISSETTSREKKTNDEKKQETESDWDELRKMHTENEGEIDPSRTDSANWDAVRRAPHNLIAALLEKRGMHNIIAGRIKNFLDRIVKDHGKIDLEWLRDVPPEKAQEYLLSFEGLGLKSVECIRLLSLQHHAFPVDTNIARVVVRLGWVPLQPLPEELLLHQLESYPQMDKIQQYLFPRLSFLDVATLYELHCQLITFGKVFCTKKKPNCKACPMRLDCKHFASTWARENLLLPSSEMRSEERTTHPSMPDQYAAGLAATAISSCSEVNISDSNGAQSHEPIIELPASPEHKPPEPSIPDIEDFGCESNDNIPTIDLKNTEALKENLRTIIAASNIFDERDMAQALVTWTEEAARVPKMKHEGRLRTAHFIYVLPDRHPLLYGFPDRETDDPRPYILAIEEASNLIEDSSKSAASHSRSRSEADDCVRGTILIPVRTATEGRFPLNGTYFQVNEVFADDETSHNPITFPRRFLQGLPRRILYCGSSASSIFRDSTLEEVQYSFWRGFICVRGFNRTTRQVTRLHTNLYHRNRTKEIKQRKNGIST